MVKENEYGNQKDRNYIIAGVSILGVLLILTLSNTYSISKIEGMLIKDTPSSEDTPTSAGSGQQVVIEEYSDFQCPYCKRAMYTLKQLSSLYGDKIKLEFRHFPLGFHENAQKAAEASECARDQGKFWEYHDLLFENQQALSMADLKKYAGTLKLDASKFNSCLDNGLKKDIVNNQMLEGQSKGVSGTPAFFIGGELITGARPMEYFIPVIDRYLNSK